MAVRIENLRERTVAVAAHDGPIATMDATRRPLYRHMILHELVGGPSIVRFKSGADASRVDALVVTHAGFEGDEVVKVDHLPAGRYAVEHYEGPEEGLDQARASFLEQVADLGHTIRGPLLQVHHMDAIDGVVEQELQVLLA